jgi:hypothetical protein
MSIRVAASLAAAALFCACAGPKASTTAAGASPPAAASAAPAAQGPAGGATAPANAPVPGPGAAGAIPLDPAQRAALDAAVAKVPAGERARLRYALASGDDGKPHLVVYDGQGLGAAGRHPGKPHEYIVFRVINATNGEHYDPQQNSVIAPIPPPPQREGPTTP